MTDESTELLTYAKTGSEDAFAALVQRYLPVVYASALRRVGGDVHRAQDVTQMVFAALARNAASLAHHPNLIGWLFTTTRYLGAKARNAEQRQRTLPREAEMIAPEPSPLASGASEQLHSVLDDLVAELKEVDRRAILLRFYRGLRLAEIGRELGLSENAAQKRLERTLEQLKDKLSRRGVTSTAAAIAVALEAQSAIAVPAGLAAASTGAAVATGFAGSGLFASLGFVTLTKLHLALLAALLLAASAGLVWEHTTIRTLRVTVDRQGEDFRAQLARETKRATLAEAQTIVWQKAAEAAQARTVALSSAAPQLIDPRGLMTAAMNRAEQLKREGKTEEALHEYLRAYRALREIRTGNTGVSLNLQQLAQAMTALGQTFPPALSDLHELRDEAVRKFQASPNDMEVAQEIAQLNHRLSEDNATLALYDSLPRESGIRQALAQPLRDALIEAHRYDEALTGQSFGNMLQSLEQNSPSFARSGPTYRDLVIHRVASDIEVLAGAGKSNEARVLIEKLLTLDASEATRTILKERLDRAGAGSLLPSR
jgi:RNA polymerase sigma factor (sigma-70 family)